jgi:hypothetical protein
MFVAVKGGGFRPILPPQERTPADGNADEEGEDDRDELSPGGRSLLGRPWPRGADLQRLRRLLRRVTSGTLHVNSVSTAGEHVRRRSGARDVLAVLADETRPPAGR